jgi:hypothetical protein
MTPPSPTSLPHFYLIFLLSAGKILEMSQLLEKPFWSAGRKIYKAAKSDGTGSLEESNE